MLPRGPVGEKKKVLSTEIRSSPHAPSSCNLCGSIYSSINPSIIPSPSALDVDCKIPAHRHHQDSRLSNSPGVLNLNCERAERASESRTAHYHVEQVLKCFDKLTNCRGLPKTHILSQPACGNYRQLQQLTAATHGDPGRDMRDLSW
ncbi:unnamed protein product, partial [Mycena citricolor]